MPFKDASPRTKRAESSEVIPTVCREPLTSMLLSNDESPNTFNFWFKDTSPSTIRVESSEVSPTVRNELFMVVVPPTTKTEFKDTSPDTFNF